MRVVRQIPEQRGRDLRRGCDEHRAVCRLSGARPPEQPGEAVEQRVEHGRHKGRGDVRADDGEGDRGGEREEGEDGRAWKRVDRGGACALEEVQDDEEPREAVGEGVAVGAEHDDGEGALGEAGLELEDAAGGGELGVGEAVEHGEEDLELRGGEAEVGAEAVDEGVEEAELLVAHGEDAVGGEVLEQRGEHALRRPEPAGGGEQ